MFWFDPLDNPILHTPNTLAINIGRILVYDVIDIHDVAIKRYTND
jgi:hypothetical protein